MSHDKITHVFVPGVAFDRKGSRLGMGKGYYDRFLPELKAIKIGIGLSAQIADFDLPVEEHDVALDYIVTEKFIIEPVEKEDL